MDKGDYQGPLVQKDIIMAMYLAILDINSARSWDGTIPYGLAPWYDELTVLELAILNTTADHLVSILHSAFDKDFLPRLSTGYTKVTLTEFDILLEIGYE